LFEENDVQILLKFVDSQFTEGTLDGKFYFSRNRYFIDLEENQIDKGIGDKREGNWTRAIDPKEEKFFISTENGETFPLNFEKAVFRQTYEGLKDLPICCFVLLSLKEDFEVYEEENKIFLKPEIEEKLIEQFENRDLIVITDAGELFNRFSTACEKENLNRMRGKVTYYDDEVEQHPLSQEEFDKDPAKALFYKRKFFEFQKEYRLVIKNNHQSDRILDIGNVRDIAYNLGKVAKGKSLPIEIRYREKTESDG